jgi:hypothetical protein
VKALPLFSASVATPIHRHGEVTSAHLRQRARDYRYAAAMTDDAQKRQMFDDLAFMFEQISHDFTRFEAQRNNRST